MLTEGSVLRHLLVMTLTSAIGIVAIFAVDVLSMFYIALTRREDWIAAVSLMAKVLFFPFTLNVGLAAGIGTAVSVALGAGNRQHAREAATTGILMACLLGIVVAIVTFVWRADILQGFGAEGESYEAAMRLLVIVVPANALVSVGMGASSVLRGSGDARRAMLAGLAGVVVTIVGDPLCIFALGQGVDGIGTAIVASRIAFASMALWAVIRHHRLMGRMSAASAWKHVRSIGGVACPAMLGGLAVPLGDWYIARRIWHFGLDAFAAAGLYDRLLPFLFSLAFALSLSVGPIIGQNRGAGAIGRMRTTFVLALLLAAAYGSGIILTLFAVSPSVAGLFELDGKTRDIFVVLCRYGAVGWAFAMLLQVSVAVLNADGGPVAATVLNWLRATACAAAFGWFVGDADLPLAIAVASAATTAVALSSVIFVFGRLQEVGRSVAARDGAPAV